MANPAQAEFRFDQVGFGKSKNPSREEVAWFSGRLTGHGWLTAAEVLEGAGLPVCEANRRRLRAIASASGGRIMSGPGTPGYCLTLECTAESFARAETGMRHQIREMARRLVEVRRVFHKAWKAGVTG